MCGIAGFCDFCGDYRAEDGALRRLVAMRTALSHRGRDGSGEYLLENVGLSHARLSIRDIARGAQPMVRSCLGAEYAIVFNGEIYNTDELRRELGGFSFETDCDTEAILYCYIRYGEKCPEMLNGIFAFAIWDGARRRLFMARDRVGVKPLFYSLSGSELLFGSEIKALFSGGVRPKIGDDGLREIFAIGPARTPGNGVFDGVRELRPGCLAVFDENGFSEKPYWSLTAAPHEDSYEDTVRRVEFLLGDSIRRQMVSDLPVCSFLSGGVDSAIVSAVCDSVSEGYFNTFTFDFKGNDEFFKPNSFQPERDGPYVELMLKKIKARHTRLICDESCLPELLYRATEARDLPGMADVDASLLYFCRLVAEKNKVALTGECADEIFGGYPWFYREELRSAEGFPWGKNFLPRTCMLKDDVIRRLSLEEYSQERYRESVAEAPLLDGEPQEEARTRQLTYLCMKWFMQTLLERMDRMSMASGLEARVPFADHRIVEYLYNVPWSFKMRGGVEKSLLRDAFAGILPKELLTRKKSPYPKTYSPHYESALRSRLAAVIADDNSPLLTLVERKKAESFLSSPADYNRPWYGQLMTSVQLMAYMLQVNFWLKRYACTTNDN